MSNHLQSPASGATASRPSTPRSAFRTPQFRSAFTLIEILVVISIIAILSALILGIAGHAMNVARRSRVETERTLLETAIQSYKAAKGFYPQDDPVNYSLSPLYYELTGTTITLNNANPPAPVSYYSAASGDTLNVATDFTNIFNGAVGGFLNASPDAAQVQNFFGATGKSARTGHVTNGVPNTLFTVFGVPVSGPVQFKTTNGAPISPWFYNSSNPTNNPGSYDLWMDVFYSGKTNRISNWSQTPQPQ